MKRVLAALVCAFLLIQQAGEVQAAGILQFEEETDAIQNTENTEAKKDKVSAPSALLMEASTGKVIYEKNADEQRHPASVTKIMTLLLIFDALEEGKISLEDKVTVSEYAASMGGSQVFLEPGEEQTVDTMIKCIAVASANDASVAMAEFVWGSEEEFVKHMNERAKGLGMENTSFVNCNGLDTEGHLTTARDIALMSRELILTYPQIRGYVTIWMENITHTTAKGASEFGLANTNKLIRQYAYATGLKTGSTGEAGFCMSATAEKNQMQMIAVVMGAKDSKSRFQDAVTLLDHGFASCVKYTDDGLEGMKPVKVEGGMKDQVPVKQKESFSYIDTEGADLTAIEKDYQTVEKLKAPVKTGEKAGSVVYTLEGKTIGSIDVITVENVREATYTSILEKVLKSFFIG